MRTTSRSVPAEPSEARGLPTAHASVNPAVAGEAALASPVDPSLVLPPGAPELRPVFPLEEKETGLVLYAGPPGEMRIHWRLHRDDFEQAAASFPVSGGRPTMVVRLRRDRPQGGTEPADEILLGLGVRDGNGECAVQIPTDHCRYHAELGLANAGGGWLMLARSNGLYNAVGIGLDLDRLPRRQGGGGLRRVPPQGAVLGVVAPPSPGTGAQVSQAESPVEPALGEAAPPADAEFPLIQWEGSPATSASFSSSAAQRDSGHFIEPGVGVGRVREPQFEGPVGWTPREGSGSEASAPSGLALMGAEGQALGPVLHEGPSGPLASSSTRIGVAIEPLTYESPPPAGAWPGAGGGAADRRSGPAGEHRRSLRLPLSGGIRRTVSAGAAGDRSGAPAPCPGGRTPGGADSGPGD
jgi:hypothetical protein